MFKFLFSPLPVKLLLTTQSSGIKILHLFFLASCRIIFIVSKVSLKEGNKLEIKVNKSQYKKCERCWHYFEEVSHDDQHKELCSRCINNLFKEGEARLYA